MATNVVTEPGSIIDKRKHPFGDLGKPTLRGVRKCPKCGTFNGTRGISCKNKECDVVFKERERKKGHSAESVKIITESTSQLYSVRLRDRGPDYRGFVQLPFIQDMEGNPATVLDTSVLIAASVCYVESCNRNVPPDPNSIVKGTSTACVHIKAAISCGEQATPITLKNDVFNNLQVSNDMKQAIWLLATETSGPVVQRVTKNIMVVKCKITPKQPLGFLHCAFFETARNRQQPDFKFQCTCKAFKMRNAHAREDRQRCVHYYACVCAFASDEKLSKEFAPFIYPDQSVMTVTLGPERQMLSVYPGIEDQDGLAVTSDAMEFIISEEDMMMVAPEKKVKSEDPVAQASSALLTLQEQKQPGPTTLVTPQQIGVKAAPQFQIHQPQPQVAISVQGAQQQKANPKKLAYQAPVDESSASISFQQWLASVTERINQTMHYGFSGSPDPLVFHAPQVFFDCLQQRISSGTRKKRLPNYITGFVRKEALPLGTFTKYTWHITNIMQVKQIFDSQEILLDLSRSFVENRDGSYDPYDPRPDVYGDTSSKMKTHLPIRPFELKTYLKVGPSAEHKDPVPFIIEWIPDILPRCHIGELRIKFEYGHQRNGQIENRAASAVNINNPVAPTDVSLNQQPIQLRDIVPS